mmetsp:Transcript_59923/g.141772  ORF Transcript_59923/g.141772 Transcript_59923/m.141772 type:complete len:238 (+) Transcript_59923:2317-3030(+)
MPPVWPALSRRCVVGRWTRTATTTPTPTPMLVVPRCPLALSSSGSPSTRPPSPTRPLSAPLALPAVGLRRLWCARWLLPPPLPWPWSRRPSPSRHGCLSRSLGPWLLASGWPLSGRLVRSSPSSRAGTTWSSTAGAQPPSPTHRVPSHGADGGVTDTSPSLHVVSPCRPCGSSPRRRPALSGCAVLSQRSPQSSSPGPLPWPPSPPLSLCSSRCSRHVGSPTSGRGTSPRCRTISPR